MDDDRDPQLLVGLSFAVGALSGLAHLLQSKDLDGKPVLLTIRVLLGAILNSGLFGMAIVLIWCYSGFAASTHWAFVLGLSALAGLGGQGAIDQSLKGLQRLLRAWILRTAQNMSDDDDDDDEKPPRADHSPPDAAA